MIIAKIMKGGVHYLVYQDEKLNYWLIIDRTLTRMPCYKIEFLKELSGVFYGYDLRSFNSFKKTIF
jgi:hypothetical protein